MTNLISSVLFGGNIREPCVHLYVLCLKQRCCGISAVGQMVVAKVLSRHYADLMLYGQSIVYHEHCVSVSRELKDKRLEGEYLEILSTLYLSLNTEK